MISVTEQGINGSATTMKPLLLFDIRELIVWFFLCSHGWFVIRFEKDVLRMSLWCSVLNAMLCTDVFFLSLFVGAR